jgi:universal stress protein E
MHRFKNILLVYECDESTVKRAALLAKNNRGKLTILHPIKQTPADWGGPPVGRKPIDVQKLVRQEHQARLREVADSVKSLGVRPTTRVVVGEPFPEIIRDVIENKRDLVIMTAERKGA